MELQYYKTFTKNTSQGIVGLLKPLKTRSDNVKKIFTLDSNLPMAATDFFFITDSPLYPIYVFKISKEVNYLLDHEYKVSKDLQELSAYLPHYNRIYEIKKNVKCYLPEKNKKIEYNPFSYHNCIRDVLIGEYIPSKLTLLEYLTDSLQINSSFSQTGEALIHQTLLALFIAQQEKNFTHYDLHLENILIRKCVTNTYFLYRFLYNGVVIERLIHTKGYFPVIFDYGFAYSKSLENTSYNNSLFYTSKGYTPFMFDEITDLKTLLVRLSFIYGCPKKYKELTDKYFFKSENITFKFMRETGWIKNTKYSAARKVSKKLEKIIIAFDPNYKKNFIYKELDEIIDLFSILTKLPFQNVKKPENINASIENFSNEWRKIDNWFSPATDDKLNVLKRILQILNSMISDRDVGYNNHEFLKEFKLKIFKTLDMYGNFINLEDFSYEIFLTSIIEISNFIEHVSYREIEKYKKEYLLTNSVDNWSLFTEIEKLVENFSPFLFSDKDSIVVFDCIEKCTTSFDLRDEEIIQSLNLLETVNDQIELINNLNFEK